MKRKVIGVLFAFIICLSGTGSVFAASRTLEPRWAQLASISCDLDDYDGWFSNARVIAEAQCKTTSYKVTLTVSIQKKSGSQYVDTGTSWTSGPNVSAAVDKTFSLDPGTYIAHAVATVTDLSGHTIETITLNSPARIVI